MRVCCDSLTRLEPNLDFFREELSIQIAYYPLIICYDNVKGKMK